jgi:transposase-like protein
MKKSRSAEARIMGVLRHATGGVPVVELCREHGMSSASLLQMAIQIRRHGRIHDQPDEGPRG